MSWQAGIWIGRTSSFEDVLSKMERQRQEMEAEKREAARLRLQMEQDATAAKEHRKRLETERAKLLERRQGGGQRNFGGSSVPCPTPCSTSWIR